MNIRIKLGKLGKTGTRARRGSAMIAGIFVVLVVSTLSMSYLQLSMNRSRENATSVDAKRAFYMAEAGLAEGYVALVSGQSGVIGSPDSPAVYANGVFWVEATSLSPTRTQLRSTGLAGTGRDSLTVVVERTTRTLAEFGLFGDEGVQVGIGATIKAYDSRMTEEVDPVPIGERTIGEASDINQDLVFGNGTSRLRVGSNQDITFIGDRAVSTIIDGDVVPGPLGSVVMGPGVSVTGSTVPAASTADLNVVSAPSARDAGSFVYGNVGQTFIHEPARCLYDTFRVAGGTVVIEGPAEIGINQLLLASGAELTFDTSGGPIRLYVAERLVFASGSTLSSTQPDPTQLMIAVSAADGVAGDGSNIKAVDIDAGGEFHGFIYSPLADLRLNADLDYYGTMIGKKIQLAPSSTLHYDEALLDLFTDGSQIATDMLAWRFVELPDAEIVKTRVDPIKWMKLNGKTLNSPSESHDDDWDGEVDAGDISRNRGKGSVIN